MVKSPIVFIHGWTGGIGEAGNRDSFGRIPQILLTQGYDVHELHLAEYTTGNDHLTIDDYAIAMNDAVIKEGLDKKPFDLIVYSTGALVCRRWLSHDYKDKKKSPVRKLIMVAAANNGSRLAEYGGQLPWEWGNQVLEALKLGSRITWDLNWEWLESQRHTKLKGLDIYHVMGANQDHQFPGLIDLFDDLAGNLFGLNVPAFEEEGSDNTIRFCSSNLNMRGVKLGENQTIAEAKGNLHEISGLPIYLFPGKSHYGNKRGLLHSVRMSTNSVYKSIKSILDGDGQNGPLPVKDYPDKLNYMMLAIRTVDQMGNPYTGAVPEFYFGSAQQRRAKYIDPVHHRHDDDINCFYLKYKDLKKVTRFGFRIFGQVVGESTYWPTKAIQLYRHGANDNFLKPRQTHFIEVTVKKTVSKKAFNLEHPKP